MNDTECLSKLLEHFDLWMQLRLVALQDRFRMAGKSQKEIDQFCNSAMTHLIGVAHVELLIAGLVEMDGLTCRVTDAGRRIALESSAIDAAMMARAQEAKR